MKTTHMIKRAVAVGLAAATVGLASAHIARAADSVPVIELFTSQGCSSCPSADKLFESYAKRTDVVALSLAVDYWDYLGWKDTLASPKYSSRQRDYAQGRADGQVYTPQIVVNGRDHAVGSNRQAIDAALMRSSPELRNAPITFTVSSDGKSLDIVKRGDTRAPAQPAIVWIVTVSSAVRVKVERGENRGRDLTYYNVVRDLVSPGTWTGDRTKLALDAVKVPAGEGAHRAALLQAGRGGPLVAAAWLD